MPRRWTTPAAAAGANCWDRNHHGPPLPLNGTKTQDYNGACSSPLNNDPNKTPGDYGLPVAAWAPPACPNVIHPIMPPCNVCHFCQHNIQKQGWLRAAKARMTKPPPSRETPSWRGFLTRLCEDCQIAEQLLIDARLGTGFFVLPNHPTVAVQGTMTDYPRNTCTCLPLLTEGVLCLEHRYDNWDAMQPAGAPILPAQRVAKRDRAERFLEIAALSIALGGITGTASAPRTGTRNRSRKYRSCRCGAEVVKYKDARIFHCMGCDGIVLYDANRPVANMPPVPTPRQVWNSSQGLVQFSMTRPIRDIEV